ncbi:MAG TPA: hypothetical protein VN181_06685 [Thermoanaerobaculia bacterium]|nr:hypothetical protein [Thermoanaerobaculia bacterium]
MSSVTVLFYAFVAFALAITLTDWRRGWLLAMLCGVLQDPARKLTPGTPVVMSFSIVIIFAAILFVQHARLLQEARQLARRFPNLAVSGALLFFFLGLAALNGLFTFGLAAWKVPAVSLFIYVVPVTGVLVGFAWVRKEEDIDTLFKFYAVITSIGLLGTPLEYFRVKWSALGTVAIAEDYIRHLPGLQIRLLSGFYRAPDIMGWHAATLTAICMAMGIRAGVLRRAWPWMLGAGWGFFCCLISGRRKAVYYVAVFAGAFLWRYIRRLGAAQVIALALTAITLAGVVREVAKDEKSSVYARGAVTSQSEILGRLEGGFFDTIEQFGLMGAGLGSATQGVRHFLGTQNDVGWQEGGLGKLTVELGVPGLLAGMLLMFVLFRLLLRVTAVPDVRGSTQITRVTLFALLVANVLNFMVAAQAYTDAVLTLTSAFFLGALLQTTTLDEKVDEESVEAVAATAPLPARA